MVEVGNANLVSTMYEALGRTVATLPLRMHETDTHIGRPRGKFMPCIPILTVREIFRCTDTCLACLARNTISTFGWLHVSLLDFPYPTGEFPSHHKPRSKSAWLVRPWRGEARRCQWAATHDFPSIAKQRWNRLLRQEIYDSFSFY